MILILTACGGKDSDQNKMDPFATEPSLFETWVQPLSNLKLTDGEPGCTQNVIKFEEGQLLYGELAYEANNQSCTGLTQSFEEPYYRLKYTIVETKKLKNGYTDLNLFCQFEYYQCPTAEIHFAIKLEKAGQELSLVTRAKDADNYDFSQAKVFTLLGKPRQ